MERTWEAVEDEGGQRRDEGHLVSASGSVYGPDLEKRIAAFVEEQEKLDMHGATVVASLQGLAAASKVSNVAGGAILRHGRGNEGGLSSTFMRSIQTILVREGEAARKPVAGKGTLRQQSSQRVGAGAMAERGMMKIRESVTHESNLRNAVHMLRNQDLVSFMEALVRHAKFKREDREVKAAFEGVVREGLLKPHIERSLEERGAIEGFCKKFMPHFFGMSPYALQVVCSQVTLEHYKAGEVVMCEGDEGDDFYMVASGLLVVWQRLGTKDEETRRMRWELDRIGGAKGLRGTKLLREMYEKEGLGHLVERRADFKGALARRKIRHTAKELVASQAKRTEANVFLGTQIATKRRGELFGERAVLFGTTRNASVSAAMDTYVLKLNRLQNLRTVQLTEEQELRRDMNVLARVPFLGGETVQALRTLAVECSTRKYPAGTIVLSEGKEPDGLYIIRSGTADMVQAIATYRERSVREGGVHSNFPALRRELDRIGRQGTHIKVAVLGALDHFGDLSMLSGCAQPCTVVASTDMEVLHLPASRYTLALTEKAVERLWLTCTGKGGAYPTLEDLHLRLVEVTEWNRAKRGVVLGPGSEANPTATLVAETTVAQIILQAPVSPVLKQRVVELQDKAYTWVEAAHMGAKATMWRRREHMKLSFLGPEVPLLFVKVLPLHPSEGNISPWAENPSMLRGKDWSRLKTLFATDTYIPDTFCLDVLFDEFKALAQDYGVVACRWGSDEFVVLGCQPGTQQFAIDNAAARLAKLALVYKTSALSGYYRKLLSLTPDDFMLTGTASCTVSCGLANGSLMATYCGMEEGEEDHLLALVGTGLEMARELCYTGCHIDGPRSEYAACRMTYEVSGQLPPLGFEFEEIGLYRYVDLPVQATDGMEGCHRLNGCSLPGFEVLAKGLAEGRKAAVMGVTDLDQLDEERVAAHLEAQKPAWQREVELVARARERDVYSLMLPAVRDISAEYLTEKVLAQMTANKGAAEAFSSGLKDLRGEVPQKGKADRARASNPMSASSRRMAMLRRMLSEGKLTRAGIYEEGRESTAGSTRKSTPNQGRGSPVEVGEEQLARMLRMRRKGLDQRYRLNTGDEMEHRMSEKEKLAKKLSDTKSMCVHVKAVIKLRPEGQELSKLGKDCPSAATTWFTDKINKAIKGTRTSELNFLSDFETQAYGTLYPPPDWMAVKNTSSHGRDFRTPPQILAISRQNSPSGSPTPSGMSTTLPPIPLRGKGALARPREDEVGSTVSPRSKLRGHTPETGSRNVVAGKARRVDGSVALEQFEGREFRKSSLSQSGWL